jgi:nucleotide-binding universal stress UspA family protein
LARSRVILGRVVEPFQLPSGTPLAYRQAGVAATKAINDQRRLRAEQSLQAAVRKLGEEGTQAKYTLMPGTPEMELEAEALRDASDLIVVGSRKPSPRRHYLLGSVAEKLVRHSPRSVLVVR